MKKAWNNWQKRVYMGILLTTIGVLFSTIMPNNTESMGAVFIALGGLFLISGMSLKRKAENQEK